MSAKKTAPRGPDGALAVPVREALNTLEQVLAAGWYPARRLLMSRLAELPQPGLPVWVPEADLEETPVEVVVSFALPGVEKADIRLQATEDCLVVSGTRRGTETPRTLRAEQPRGEFLRKVPLPCAVKPSGAKASYRNGVLRVTLPRAKAAFGRSIKVD